jgi:hypothetical protein
VAVKKKKLMESHTSRGTWINGIKWRGSTAIGGPNILSLDQEDNFSAYTFSKYYSK